jgi:hypothetical protein
MTMFALDGVNIFAKHNGKLPQESRFAAVSLLRNGGWFFFVPVRW